MAYVNTGNKRSLSFSLNKKIGGVVQVGYPKTYDGRGAFPGYPAITDLEASRLTDVAYEDRLTAFQSYVEEIEVGLDADAASINNSILVDPSACPPPPTTTLAPATTTTSTLIPVTTTTTTTIPCDGLGLLYNFYAVDDPRNIANDGWHVPSDTEFVTFIEYMGETVTKAGYSYTVSDTNSINHKLREPGTVYWDDSTGTNDYGFGLRGAGTRNVNTGVFEEFRSYAQLHSSTEAGDGNVYLLQVQSSNTYVNIFRFGKVQARSIRLLKDSTTLSHGQTGTYIGNDGKEYPTICIGTQEWLATNLAETKFRTGESIVEVTDDAAWQALTTAALCAYDNNWSNVCPEIIPTTTTTTVVADCPDCIGALYNHYAVIDARGIAPAGWRVPTLADCNQLMGYLEPNVEIAVDWYGAGRDKYASPDSELAFKLRRTGNITWLNNEQATNSSGFCAVGAGYRFYNGTFLNKGEVCMFRTSEFGHDSQWAINLYIGGGALTNPTPDYYQGTVFTNEERETGGISVRLIKEDSIDPGTVTDYDGNTYPTVKIGSQVWMAKNLEVAHYNNGDVIPKVANNTAWQGLTTGGMCYYDNDESNSCYPTEVGLGLLYNTHVIEDSREIANVGWKLPSIDDFIALFNFDGGVIDVTPGTPNTYYTSDAVYKFREVGLTHWNDPGSSYPLGTDEYGLRLVGSARRYYDGEFQAKHTFCTFAVSDIYTPDLVNGAWRVVWDGMYNESYTDYGNKKMGLSVRFIKETTSLAHGETGTYTDNSGNTYLTICINGTEWMAENLKDTRYRTGDSIPEVTDAAVWSALTTHALCAFDNDWNNV